MTNTAELWKTMEAPLLDELKPYLQEGPLGQNLHHPLIISIGVWDGMAGLLNQQYLARKKATEEALNAGLWRKYIYLHERPYRYGALQDCLNDGLWDTEDTDELWRIIHGVWIDSENIWQNAQGWRMILETFEYVKDEAQKSFMIPDDLATLKALPEEIPVWRGVTHKDAVQGYSWTNNEAKARWFAQRYSDDEERPPFLAAGTVKKEHVLAFISERSEDEIVVLPEHIMNLTVTPLKAPRRRRTR